jgi:uncharacterized protein involved in cysteine biosynthesis
VNLSVKKVAKLAASGLGAGAKSSAQIAVATVATEVGAVVAASIAGLLKEEIEKTLRAHPDLGIRKATTQAKKHLKETLPSLKDAVQQTISVEDSTLTVSLKPVVEAIKHLPHLKSDSSSKQ